MSIRTLIAILLGLALGLTVSGLTYFNDAVIRQTMFIGNHLPISVFGLAIVVLLLVNPLLRLLGARATLSTGQIALIVAVGLTACAWPGSNFFRIFTGITAMPAHLAKNRPGWQGVEVFSYVPGGSPRLAPGHVHDWPALARSLVDAEPGTPLTLLRQRMNPAAVDLLRETARTGRFDPAHLSQVLPTINDVIVQTADPIHADPAMSSLDLGEEGEILRRQRAGYEQAVSRPIHGDDPREVRLDQLAHARAAMQIAAIDERLNRLTLVAAAPDQIAPPPPGEGLLLNGGRPDPFGLDMLVQGWDVKPGLRVGDLPWSQWWPTIRTHGGMALTLGLAALCLAVIVHPQWSRRELLAYPIARFIDELAERPQQSWLPTIVRNRLFWYAFIAMVGLHLINGLNAWFPDVPKINLTLPLQPLSTLFPNAARVSQAWAAWAPVIYPTAVAFAFFLATDVSFSIGAAQLLWLAMGAMLVANGVQLENDFSSGEKGQMLRFGGYLAMTAMILYVGRRHYLSVAAGMIGLPAAREAPASAVWAARLLAVFLVLAVWVCISAGLDPLMSVMFVGLCMIVFLVVTRIVTETGLFFVQSWWMPMGVLTAMFGASAMGPTTYLALALPSVMLVGDPRETLMPYISNALQIGDRTANVRPGRLAWPIALMILAGFLVAMVVTFHFSYNRGANLADVWATQTLPSMPFERAAQMASELTATGELAQTTALSGLQRLGAIKPDRGAFLWLGIGAGLTAGAALARLRLPWWPIHPVLFLVWGTYPNAKFFGSFLIGWAIKAAIVRTVGAKGYHGLKPFMVGIIAGELISGLAWMAVGAVYFFATNQVPKSYSIFPG